MSKKRQSVAATADHAPSPEPHPQQRPAVRVVDVRAVHFGELLRLANESLTAGRGYLVWQDDSGLGPMGSDYLLKAANTWDELARRLDTLGILDLRVAFKGDQKDFAPLKALRLLALEQRPCLNFDERFLDRLATTVELLRKTGEPDHGKPHWDAERQVLLWNASVLKRYTRNPARNQIDILEAFERDGWPPTIPDPFNDKRKLNQTIRDLNNSLPDGTIRFHGDGSGEGVDWRPASPQR